MTGYLTSQFSPLLCKRDLRVFPDGLNMLFWGKVWHGENEGGGDTDARIGKMRWSHAFVNTNPVAGLSVFRLGYTSSYDQPCWRVKGLAAVSNAQTQTDRQVGIERGEM